MSGTEGTARGKDKSEFVNKRVDGAKVITAHRIVTLSTDAFHAKDCVAFDEVPYGIAGASGAANSDLAVPICIHGFTEVECGDAVTAGQWLMPDAAGKAIPYTAGVEPGTYYPIARAETDGADGQIILCFVHPVPPSGSTLAEPV